MKRMSLDDWSLRIGFATEQLRGPLPEAMTRADADYHAALDALDRAREHLDKASRPAAVQVRKMVRSILGKRIYGLAVRLRVHEDYERRRNGEPGWGMPGYEIAFMLDDPVARREGIGDVQIKLTGGGGNTGVGARKGASQ